DVARREQIRDAGRAAPPAHLLIVAEREIHGAARLGSRPEEMLHRLAESDEAALVVERAPAPHISAGDPALQWRLGPAGRRPGLARAERERALEYDDCEDHHQDEQGAESLFHDASLADVRVREARATAVTRQGVA